jgi:hypothetical protein
MPSNKRGNTGVDSDGGIGYSYSAHINIEHTLVTCSCIRSCILIRFGHETPVPLHFVFVDGLIKMDPTIKSFLCTAVVELIPDTVDTVDVNITCRNHQSIACDFFLDI